MPCRAVCEELFYLNQRIPIPQLALHVLRSSYSPLTVHSFIAIGCIYAFNRRVAAGGYLVKYISITIHSSVAAHTKLIGYSAYVVSYDVCYDRKGHDYRTHNLLGWVQQLKPAEAQHYMARSYPFHQAS